MNTNGLLKLKLAMAEGHFLLLSRMDESTDEEVAEAEIRMIKAHRALQGASK